MSIQPQQKAGLILLVLAFSFFVPLFSQQGDQGSLSGNFQSDTQYYFQDSSIGTPAYPEIVGSNNFMYLSYQRGPFRAGARFEAYYPPLQGFVRRRGAGIAHRFAEYNSDKLTFTAGTFYEQFGSGMLLRAYEEWGLGYDNALDGVRAKLRPMNGIEITGLIAKQRNAIDPYLVNQSEGIIRAADANFSLNEIIPFMDSMKTRFRVGGGFVSRFQADEDPIQILPENVATYGARASVARGGFKLGAEYVYKINDPSSVNNLIYKPGTGILVQAAYSQRGLGVTLNVKRIDNMDYRSERGATFNNLLISFQPPQTRQHTFRLATLFPWATQTLGEAAGQLEVIYTIPKDTKLGGPYGTTITFNASRIHGIKKYWTTDPDMGYTSKLFGFDKLYFQDINLDITRKFSKKFKAGINYFYFMYDEDLFTQLTGFKSTSDVKAHVAVVEMSYKFNKKHNLRWELQHCYTKQEFGSWAMALVEYTLSPHLFVAVFDEYNYGNAEPDKRLHYYTANAGVNYGNFRVTGGYGRQRAGVLCVGGVCRVVPASNGFTLSVSGTF